MVDDSNVSEFFDDILIKNEVEMIWGGVILATQKLLQNAELFGFDEIELKSNPNIHQLITATSTIDFMLGRALDDMQCLDNPDHTLVRMILNAKQNILHMKEIATALKLKDKEIYAAAIERLKTQAQF